LLLNNQYVLYSYIYYIYIYYNVIRGFAYKLHHKFNKNGINDSVILLQVISSHTMTIWFFVIVVSFFLIKYYKNSTVLTILLSVSLSFYFCDSRPNLTYVTMFFRGSLINLNLQNGLVNIHPLIIYYIYGTIIYIWLINYYNNTYHIRNFIYGTNLYTLLGLTSAGILLGALWASQELNWGGFWSWDPVELVSLMALFFFIKLFHQNRLSPTLNTAISVYVCLVVIIYLIIRVGIVTTIHSFIRTKTNPLYITYIYIYFLSVILLNVYIYYFIYKYYEPHNSTQFYERRLIFHMYSALLNTLVAYLFYLISLSISELIVYRYFNLSSMYNFYIIVILFSVLLYKKNNSIIFSIWLLLIISVVLYAYKLPLLLVYLVILMNSYKLNYKALHIVLFVGYMLFYIFFTPTPVYSSFILFKEYFRYTVNAIALNLPNRDNYEIFFFLKKHGILNLYKTLWTHVSGFNVYTNNIYSVFVFSKNSQLNYIFGEGLLNLIVWLILIIIGVYIFYLYDLHAKITMY
jgi:cytochrome c biogenesis factor